MDATMKDILLKLRWVGHLAQTGEQRIPMQLSFGELVRRWRNLATADSKSIDVDREWWRAVYSDGLAQLVDSNRGVQSLQATKPTTVRREFILVSVGGLSDVRETFQSTAAYVVCPTAGPDVPDIHICTCGRSFTCIGDLMGHNYIFL